MFDFPTKLRKKKDLNFIKLVESLFTGSLSTVQTTWRVIPLSWRRSVKECESDVIIGTFFDFYQWSSGQELNERNPFYELPRISDNLVGLYADYKYLHEIFRGRIDELVSALKSSLDDKEDKLGLNDSKIYLINQESHDHHLILDWSDFIPNINAITSTIWIGSRGAHTPLHYDTYGQNCIIQISGTKSWHFWKPHSPCLLTSRIPYEESSVYCLNHDPLVENTSLLSSIQPDLIITLHAGDVLFVPKHWWHFVRTVSLF
jgi:hypothetical protein